MPGAVGADLRGDLRLRQSSVDDPPRIWLPGRDTFTMLGTVHQGEVVYPGEAPREWATVPQAWAKGKLSGMCRTIRRTEEPTRAPILRRQSRRVET